MKITALATHFEPGSTITTHERERIARFASELGDAAGIAVPIIEAPLTQAPGDGFVLLFTHTTRGLEHQPELCRRAVLIPADQHPRQLERYQLLGGVDVYHHLRWLNRDPGGGCILGYKHLAERIGATISALFCHERYAPLLADEHRDTPALLAAYLAAVEAEAEPQPDATP